MKNHKISHCSDEFLLEDVKNNDTLDDSKVVEFWKEMQTLEIMSITISNCIIKYFGKTDRS